MNRQSNSGMILILMIILQLLLLSQVTSACTVFCINKGKDLVVGRNYDWPYGAGIIVINKRNQIKTAFRYWDEPDDHLARWRSKYGSITFVQYGREIAFSGMNEAGLTVHELWLEESRYPASNDQPSINLDQVVQYVLDNFQNVDEITAGMNLIRIRPNNFAKLHIFATDYLGHSCTMEFINGKKVIYSDENMPVKVMSNDTYERSISYMKGGPIRDKSSLGRFATAVFGVEKYESSGEGDAVQYSFKTLNAVKQGSLTQFQIVFDPNNRNIFFKTLRNSNIRYFSLGSFDFSPDTPSKVFNLNNNLTGDVTPKFIDYTTEINEAMIKRAWKNLGYLKIYLPALHLMSRYPTTFTSYNEKEMSFLCP